MFEAERHSAFAISSMAARSSGESLNGSAPPATLFLGVRDLWI
nr:MAG TPA: hypothetical protein [Caudoviricetes sp.]